MVLAIALTATVVYLLSMATELYMVNVEASRGRVESAQLARTLLDQIAADLTAVRVAAPAAAMGSALGGAAGGASQGGGGASGGGQPGGAQSGGGQPGGGQPGGGQSGGGQAGGGQPSGGQTGGGQPGGGQSGSAGSGSSGTSTPPPASGPTQGVFGTADQIRIDRAAYANWERTAREIDPQEAAAAADLPVTVRYFFSDANRVTTQNAAQQGVAREFATTTAGGLYRETIPTAAINPADPPLPLSDAPRSGARVELLAPEVTALALTYYNGTDLLDAWDPTLTPGLPRGVEICVTIAEPRFQARPSQEEQQRLAEGRFTESELVEYRRFVRLPLAAPSPPAQMLLPAAGQQGGGRGGGGGGQGQGGQQGQGQGGQGGQSGGNGGGSNGGGNQPQGNTGS